MTYWPRGSTRLALLALVVVTALAALWPNATSPHGGAATAEAAQAAPHGAAGQVVPLPPAPTPAPPVAICRPPTAEFLFPSPAAELRLVRDADGSYWQIQSGCRHAVTPFVMDSATLAAIPRGEDVGWVSYGLPQPVPTLAPLPDPAYARLPPYLAPPPPPPPPPATVEPAAAPPPGVLEGYTNRVLVVDVADPNAVWVLDGRLRHRVLVFFTYCAVYPLPLPLCGGDPANQPPVDPEALIRGGDPAVEPPVSYLLPRRPELVNDCRLLYPRLNLPSAEHCSDLYARLLLEALLEARPTRDPSEQATFVRLARTLAEEAAGYVANLDEIPLGEPAPYYGWARGESVVISDRPRLPEAIRCQLNEPCSRRFREARLITLGAFAKDPQAYAGQDVRIQRGVACQVRYDRGRNVTTFSYGLGNVAVSAVAPGRQAAQDPEFISNAVLEIAATVSSAATAFFNQPGQFVVFEYRRVGTGICEGES